MIDRIAALARIESAAWKALLAAYEVLAWQHPEGTQAETYRRHVKMAEQRWRRAITDLDRALGRPVDEQRSAA